MSVTEDRINDLQADVKYLKRRLAQCANANEVEELEARVKTMVHSLLTQRPERGHGHIEDRESSHKDVKCLNRRLDEICAMANGLKKDFESHIAERLGGLDLRITAEIERMSAKKQKIIDKVNECVQWQADAKTIMERLRADLNDLTAQCTEASSSSSRAAKEEDTGVHWKDAVLNAYGLPIHIDWGNLRVATARSPLLQYRIANRKWYIARDKMDFSNRTALIKRSHLKEFLTRLQDDCPTVIVGKKGKQYAFREELLTEDT